ncbi:MAG: hypothetical protein U0V02_01970 [Anaerolineales bacterium]
MDKPEEERQTLQNQTEVIALPPLRMVLVHAKEERENAILTAVIKSAAPQENVEPQDLKKIIEHLKKKDRQ